jgi:hypothetical protein
MVYAPGWLTWGFALSAVSLAGCGGLLIFGALHRRVGRG